MEEAKREIKEFVDFLKNSKKYRELGAKIPRGALLTGPPGTGKTMLAKACAGEAGVNFLYTSGSEFVEMYVGVGAGRVRELFKEAKANSPTIIFIDEIDAIGKKRESGPSTNTERDSTLNQLLVELDGFGTNQDVVIFAATNRKDILDPALIRTGRFDRSIDVTLPDIQARQLIFKVHLRPLGLSNEEIEQYSRRLASISPGFSGAEIANVCNEAAILCARANRSKVTSEDFEMAVERVIGGLEVKKLMSPEQRRKVAIHESGHGVVGWFLPGGDPLVKLTIIPRAKGSLGFAQYLPSENSLQTKEELEDRIAVILGGRCAEEEFYGEVTTGAYDDLEKAYEVALAMVTKLGMSEKIGNYAYPSNQYGLKQYSEETNVTIDEEVHRLIKEAQTKARQVIKEKRLEIEKLTDILMEKESIEINQIRKVFGERPFPPKESYKRYLQVKEEELSEKALNTSHL